MPLAPAEADFFASAGTLLRPLAKNEVGHKPGRGKDFYKLENDCANLNLETGDCMQHDSAERPSACTEFKAGSWACWKIQAESILQVRQSAATEAPTFH